jgi:hypothetical protein
MDNEKKVPFLLLSTEQMRRQTLEKLPIPAGDDQEVPPSLQYLREKEHLQ